MTYSYPPDEKGDLVEFLRANVDLSVASADAGVIEIDHADYDGGLDSPGIRVQAPESTPLRAGPTGYSGMDPGGGGGTQDVRTSLQVDAWGGTINDGDVLNEHPDIVATELGLEVWDTVRNASGDPPFQYDSIGVVERGTAHDTDVDPTEFRYVVWVAVEYGLV